MNRILPRKRAEILAAFAGGATIREIARDVGAAKQTVASVVRRVVDDRKRAPDPSGGPIPDNPTAPVDSHSAGARRPRRENPCARGRFSLAHWPTRAYSTLMNTTTTDINGVVLRETAKAYYVTLNGICDSVWIAKSLLSNVSVRYAEELGGRTIDADIPVWLWNKLPRKSGPIPYATRPW